MDKRKISIIGCGFVGATTAYTLMLNGLAKEIVVVDINKQKVEGDILDMQHGMSFIDPVAMKAGEYSDCIDSNVIIITAGVAQKEGETRNDLLKRNIKVFDSIIDSLMPFINDSTILLIVTNPVDVLTYYTRKKTNLPAHRVIGSGTVLDTARLKYAISNRTQVDARNVHTFVIGEHGDSEVPALSITSIGGLSLEGYCKQMHCCGEEKDKILEIGLKTKNSAYEIIAKKGATYYAVAMAVTRICQAILRDEHAILTVSTYIENAYGINDVYLSLPCIVGRAGVSGILQPAYSEAEVNALRRSADIIKSNIALIE